MEVINPTFQIDKVDPYHSNKASHNQKQLRILSERCLDECAAKLNKVLSASSHMTAMLEDTVFHFNLITMLKLQPASEHIHSLHP